MNTEKLGSRYIKPKNVISRSVQFIHLSNTLGNLKLSGVHQLHILHMHIRTSFSTRLLIWISVHQITEMVSAAVSFVGEVKSL
ncbi:hypothetical protein QE152_g24962 [Popillia japonica]|uniref:Uncharacterized protein n=1 Tax=Popillia japonica TaxID=7064 RepID=A0AAW1K2K8_POPJA